MVDTTVSNSDRMIDHDAVKPSDRTAAVIARSGGRNAKVTREIDQASAMWSPFIGVAHDDRSAGLPAGERSGNRMSLSPSVQTRKVEMHANDPHRRTIDPEIGDHGTARLERGQGNVAGTFDEGTAPDEQGVTMPADTARARGDIDNGIGGMMIDHCSRQCRKPCAETSIRLLQGDNIGVDFVQHLNDAHGGPPPVGPDRLADIVTREPQHRRCA